MPLIICIPESIFCANIVGIKYIFGHSRASLWHWWSCIDELIFFNAGGSYFTFDTFSALEKLFQDPSRCVVQTERESQRRGRFSPKNQGTVQPSDKLVFLCFAGQLEERLTTRS